MKYILIFLLQTALLIGGDSIKIERIDLPKLKGASISGLCEDHSGGIKFSTNLGDVWSLKAEGLSLFASGLQEPTALLKSWREGQYFALQRSEVSKLVDENRDDKADLFESFGKGWGFTGSPSEKVTALTDDIDGNYYGATSFSLGADGYANLGVKARGIVFKVDYIGDFSVFATGVESAVAAVVTPESQLLLANNAGDYQFASALYLVEEGDFLGNPLSLRQDKTKASLVSKIMRSQGKERLAKFAELRKLPSIIFPSTANLGGIAIDQTEEKLGPYSGQLFITDTSGVLYRAHLDKVGDVTQGAVFTVGEAIPKGLSKILINTEGQFYFGQKKDGALSTTAGLYKAELSKESFDVKEVKAVKDGFSLEFTKPVERFDKIELSVAKYNFSESKKGKLSEFTLGTPSFKVSVDKRFVTIILKGLERQSVVKFNYVKVVSVDGKTPLSSMAHYTLNELP
ncbi:MAG: hypothetical protein NE330_17605 [Lentisphaeraceae bacterium]|nr:hypothetical protein [Lentisphaeraceae bacterium]